jgi:hypothetical protein
MGARALARPSKLRRLLVFSNYVDRELRNDQATHRRETTCHYPSRVMDTGSLTATHVFDYNYVPIYKYDHNMDHMAVQLD